MSNTTNQPDKTPQFTSESQQERWMKYGANVVLSVIVVILLGGLVTYLAQKFSKRIDTTAAGIYSLKPQTVNLIKENAQKIKLVSLYSAKDAQDKPNEFAGPVRDLLEEYSRKGKNIEYEVIDPVKEPNKTDALVNEAMAKYGGAVAAYKSFFDEFTKTQKSLNDMANSEAALVADFPTDGGEEDLSAVISTVREAIPSAVSRMKERVDRVLKTKYPDYKVLAESLKGTLDSIAQTQTAIIKFASAAKDKESIPAPIKKYLAESIERHTAFQKLAEDTVKKIEGLGELKVTELQQAIKDENLILVLGEKEWRVINPNQVWVEPNAADYRAFADGSAEPKPRFAGEQAVTTALLSLSTGAKPKVVFLRPGGRPLTNPGFPPFQQGGPFSAVADRLRDYNFDVLEKDISGQYAMQAQMQGQQAEPEPSDEAIKDAVWIVLNLPSQTGPSPVMAQKVAEHLKAGGSAMILALPGSDNLSDALKDYGVEMLTDATIVHEPISGGARSGDFVDDIQRRQYIFVINKFGDHLLAGPVGSLDAIVVNGVPIRTNSAPGVKTTQLMPIPQTIKAWGERDQQTVEADQSKFDETGPNADLPGPLFAGAIAEKDKSRLVVIGDLVGFTNQVLGLPDQEMLKRRIFAPRFPGNGELFTNSVFWLGKMEPMIAISPAAMQITRVKDMGDGALNFWRIGVLMILLPGLVVAWGVSMYFARRD